MTPEKRELLTPGLYKRLEAAIDAENNPGRVYGRRTVSLLPEEWDVILKVLHLSLLTDREGFVTVPKPKGAVLNTSNELHLIYETQEQADAAADAVQEAFIAAATKEGQGETPQEVTKSGIPLTWTSNWRGGKAHIEWHAPCGCAWHPKPKPHWHPCEAHSPKHELSAKRDKLAEAANNMDWQQVALNGGPPCFHLEEDGRFCGRAERWAGHGDVHAYLSLAGLLERELSAKREGFVTVPRSDLESWIAAISARNVGRGMIEGKGYEDGVLQQMRKVIAAATKEPA